jgi:cyclic pyranopterin phosphate synthase
LVDGWGRVHTYLRISVTDRCDLRCVYCMPPDGIAKRPRADLLTFDEIERVARLCARLGVTKIRLTGGEPLVRRDLPDLAARLAVLPGLGSLGLTTNGVRLRAHAAALRAAGVTHLNISLDTLRPERFERIALRGHFDEVMAGIEAALAVGFARVKVNMVVMGGVNDDELAHVADLARARPLHVRFIEYMPFAFNRWDRATFVPYRTMLDALRRVHPLVPLARTDPSAVAREFTAPGFAGTVGFITSLSDHFCDACNRVRLTADGSIKTCLFHPAETNLRTALRSGAGDAELEGLLRAALRLKPDGHAPAEELVRLESRSMVAIGG